MLEGVRYVLKHFDSMVMTCLQASSFSAIPLSIPRQIRNFGGDNSGAYELAVRRSLTPHVADSHYAVMDLLKALALMGMHSESVRTLHDRMTVPKLVRLLLKFNLCFLPSRFSL